jgi:hypothetical protein
VRHCVGSSLAMVNSFSSSSRDHSVFLIDGSSHSFQRALHCLAVFFARSDAQRAHWLRPYLEIWGICQLLTMFLEAMGRLTAALSTSSSTFDHCPTLVTTMVAAVRSKTGNWARCEVRVASCAMNAAA